MSDFEEEDINKMFSEIMSSNSIEGQKNNDQNLIDIKNTLMIQESLMDTMMTINSMMYRIYTDKDYDPPQDTEKYLAALYQASEDFFSYMSQNDDTIDAIEIQFIEDFFDDEDAEEDEEE